MATTQSGWTKIDASDKTAVYTPSVLSWSSCGAPPIAGPPASDDPCLNKWILTGPLPFSNSLPASAHAAFVPSDVTLSLQFNGTGLRVYGGALFNGGNGTVTIDGKEDATPVQFLPNVASTMLYSREDLAPGSLHTLKFTFAKSSQGIVRIDNFEVFTGDASPEGHRQRVLALEIALPLAIVLLIAFALWMYRVRLRQRKKDTKGTPRPYAIRDAESGSPTPAPLTSTKEQVLFSKAPRSTTSSSQPSSSAADTAPDEELAELGVAMRRAGLTVHGLLAALHPGQNTSQRPPDYDE